MPTYSLSTSRTVLNPITAQVWNVSIRRGDDVTIALTVYEDDSATPLDVSAARSRLYLRPDGYSERFHWDYGRGWLGDAGYPDCGADMVMQDGLAVPSALGRINFVLTAGQTLLLHGRYRMLLQVALNDGSVPTVEGILQLRAGGAVTPAAMLPSAVFGIGALDPPLGAPGIGIFDNVALLPTALPGQGVLGQFRLG